MKEKILYFNDVKTELKTIDYKKGNEIPKNFKGDIKVITNDFYDVELMDNKSFKIYYERKVALDPEFLFELSVGFDCYFTLNKKSISEFENDVDSLKETINLKIEKLLSIGNVIGRVSSLISNITLQIGLNPIVTPPRLQK